MDLLKAREKARKKIMDKKSHTELESKIEQVQEEKKAEVIEIPEKKEVQKIDQSELITAKEESEQVDKLVDKKIEAVTPFAISKDTKRILYMLFQDTFESAVKIETGISAAPSIKDYAPYLVFRIGNELYGIDLELVSEVIRFRTAAYIPNAPNYVYGLITLRGHMVPVINSHLRLSLALTSTTSKSRIVIIEMNREYMGFTVDEAYNVISIEKKLIKPPPPTLTEIELELIAGVYEHENRLVILLNKDNFFKFL